jgi:hypothetical protein
MLTFKHQKVIVFIEEDHLVQCGFLPSLFENYREFLVAESTVTLLQTLQSVLSVIMIPLKVKLIE